MWWFTFKIILFFIEWRVVRCARNYDVNAEAVKLFGEDLAMLLKRFRRTSDYLSILDERVHEMQAEIEDVFSQVRYAYSVKVLPKYVNDTLLRDECKDDHKEGPKDTYALRGHGVYLRQGDANVTPSTPSPVDRLDAHPPLHSIFTVAEKNSFRDVGFKVAGLAIRKIIASLGAGGDDDVKSTRMPGELQVSTTAERAPSAAATAATTKPAKTP